MKKPDWFNLDNYSKIYELNHIEQLFLFKRKSEIIEDLRNYGLTPRCIISTQAVDQWQNYQSIIEAGASFSQEDFEDANQFFQDYENGLVCDANIHQLVWAKNPNRNDLKSI